jgi:glycosyltransferase involved in cell wall biosynthesis
MRILHLATFLQGGAGRAITDLAIAQATAGHHVIVAVDDQSAPGYESYRDYLERLDAARVPVHSVHGTFKRDLSKNVAAVATLRAIPAISRVDLIHTHAAVPSMIARLLTSPWLRGVPVVQTMHGWGIAKTEEQSATDVALMNLVDRVVVPSRTSADFLHCLGVDRSLVSIVPYGIPDDVEAPLPDHDATLLSDLRRRWNVVIGCVGTIGERKNQRLIVDALAQVRGLIAGCVFIGDGDTSGLAEHARLRGVADRTVVLGYRPNASQYVRRMHLSVLASRNEGQPLAILEAFRDGIPMIVTDIPELREIVSHRVNGLVCAEGTAKSLASAIENATRTGTRGIATQARLDYEARYTLTRMLDGYREVYERARHERSGIGAGAA